MKERSLFRDEPRPFDLKVVHGDNTLADVEQIDQHLCEQYHTKSPKSAILSPCHRYRYTLGRVWSARAPLVLFVMLNPSTAGADFDDATVNKCCGFAHQWGCGGILVANLFAWRSRDPKAIERVKDPVGPDNDFWIKRLAANRRRVILGWGNPGEKHWRRVQEVMRLLKDNKPECLCRTSLGQPGHPLFLPSCTLPFRYELKGVTA